MTPLPRVAAPTARELFIDMPLSESARELDDAQPPAAFLDALMERELFPDAARLLARGLPRQDAVWWALTCARGVVGTLPAPKVRGALDAAEAWVLAPDDEKRRATLPAAELAEIGTPAGCVAAAAFFSGGSIAPPEVAPVPPPENMTATMVASAVMLSAVKEPEKQGERYREFLQIGVEIANGRSRWPGASTRTEKKPAAAASPAPEAPPPAPEPDRTSPPIRRRPPRT